MHKPALELARGPSIMGIFTIFAASSHLSLNGPTVSCHNCENIEVNLTPTCREQDIGLYPQGAKRLRAEENRIELMDCTSIDCDYLVIATKARSKRLVKCYFENNRNSI